MRKAVTVLAASAVLLAGNFLVPVASATPVEDAERVELLHQGESIRVSDQDWLSVSAEDASVSPESTTWRAPATRATRQATPAPPCVNAVGEKGFIQVYNNCGFDVRVKVVMAFGPDSACHVVMDGTRHNIAPGVGRIDRVELC